jgi:hypothetical protein
VSEHTHRDPFDPPDRRVMSDSVAKKPNKAAGVLGLVVLGVSGWFFFGGGLEEQANRDMKTIEDKVAIDAVKEYQMAVDSGDRTDICVHAGMVAAAYQQAHDEPNYLSWKQTEKGDCAYMELH